MVSLLCSIFALILALSVPASAASPKEALTVDGITFQTVDADFGDATDTVVTGVLPDKTLTGDYRDAFGNIQGFWRYESGVILPLLGHIVQDVSLAGATGWARVPAAIVDSVGNPVILTWSFVYVDGSVQYLTGPTLGRGVVVTRVEASSINDTGQVCGAFLHPITRQGLGFLYDPVTHAYTIIDVPGTQSTACLHLTQDGRLLVRSIAPDGTKEHWVWEAGVFTPLTVPDLAEVDLVAFRDSIIAGNVGRVGVVWDGTTLHEIDVPGSTLTELAGLQVEGDQVRVFGRYIGDDGVHHGFIATIAPSTSKHGQATARAWRRSPKMQAPFTQADCWPGSKRAICRER